MLKTKLEVISQNDHQMIHDASIKILEETGVAFHSEEALEICKSHGAKVVGNIVYFTRKIVEEAIEKCPKTFQLEARNPEKSVTVGEGFLIQPNTGPVYIQDLDKGRRMGTIQDFANIQKLHQYSDVVHLVGAIPVNPDDVPHGEKHRYIFYETLKNTDKPVIGHTAYKHEVKETLDMVEIALGKKLESGYYVGVTVNPLSPLGYSDDALETIIEYANRKQAIFLAPCIMTGLSGPITLLGTALLQNVEILAGLTFIQMINPGNPVVYSVAAHTAYMKTASFIGGNPESMLMNIVNLQMGLDYYKLPTRSLSGITDAKVVDCQAGYESLQNLMLGVLGGSQIIVQCLGVLDAIMTTSYEKIIIDEELVRRVIRIKQGVEVSKDELAVEIIQEVAHNGSYLTHESTFKKCRSRWMPTISTCESYMDWQAAGSEDIVTRANRKYKEILAAAPETLLDKDVENSLKKYMSMLK